MERKNEKVESEKTLGLVLSIVYPVCPNVGSEMKRRSTKRYSVLFSVLLVLSFVSGATRLRHVALPSLRPYTDTAQQLKDHLKEHCLCDRSNNYTDICYIRGDVHLLPDRVGQNVLVQLFSSDKTLDGEEIIQPYPRKYDLAAMEKVDSVTLRSMNVEFSGSQHARAKCDTVHSVPLILFSAGGYTGNLYHDFQDVLVPLFITSKGYDGEVVFAVMQGRQWWLEKFSPVFEQMTKYEVIDLNREMKVHCFRRATIGLRIHGELKVDPALMPHNETMRTFQDMLRQAYGRIRHDFRADASYRSNCLIPASGKTDCRLKLVLVARNHTRVILNHAQVARFAEKEGFDVQVLSPWGGTDLKDLYKVIHQADVMMGVHGAALAHMFFLRPRSVLIQIVPLGTEWPSLTFYQEPAINSLDLQYIEYRITPDESTLSGIYNRSNSIVKDPEAVIGKNWETRKKIYLEGQNVRLSLGKLKFVLREAKRLASQGLH